MFTQGHLRRFLLITTLLSPAALFGQHYQGHDHTVFHRPAPPPAKHASAATATNASSAHAGDTTSRRHEATLTTPGTSHTAQPAQVPLHAK
jgi:hypothetical protein